MPLADIPKPQSPPRKKARTTLSFLTGSAPSEPSAPTSDTIFHEYLNTTEVDEDCNPLHWWSINASKFPSLAVLAKKYLGIPATSTPSERIFSSMGQVVNRLRNRLAP